MMLPFDRSEVSRRLLPWYGREGRDLPWRNTRDPYRIWLSEIMLQQTTVAAVIPYYERFLKQFPTVTQLANAPLDDVITHWAGLGYYSRARNLHKTARKVVDELSGDFPKTVKDLMELPGVGKSTAGAIVSIAYDRPAPILDGNVRRVLIRLFAWESDPRSSKAEKQLWEWAAILTPESASHDYAQAIMDLGATVCTPRSPQCECCPLEDICQASVRGLAGDLPCKRKRKKLPIRRQVIIVPQTEEHQVLIRKRPENGFLGGLWEFPAADITDNVEAMDTAYRLLSDLGLRGKVLYHADISHTYSHFKLELQVFRAEVEKIPLVKETSAVQWIAVDMIHDVAIHGAHKKALQGLDID